MPLHQEIVNNTANFVANRTHCSAQGACVAQLKTHAQFQTANGVSGELAVPDANIPAVNYAAIHGARAELHARVKANGGVKWDWFEVQARPANQPMAWGLMHAYVRAEYALLNADPHTAGATQHQRRAYFLPYRQNGITEVRLGNNADFAFTAPLGGCNVYVYRPVGQRVRFYHANAGSVVGNKQNYMDHMFRSASGVLHTHANVSVYRSIPDININVDPGITGASVRKRFHLRKNLNWYVPGATVTGRRTGADTWDFYWQTVRLLEYDRRPTLETIRGLFGGAQRVGHVMKLQSLAVHQTGLF